MLRRTLIGLIAVTLVALLVIAVAAPWGEGHFFIGWLGVQLAILLAGLAFERFRYRPLVRDAPGPGWTPTAERYTDPETGAAVQVWYHAASGERRYVAHDTAGT